MSNLHTQQGGSASGAGEQGECLAALQKRNVDLKLVLRELLEGRCTPEVAARANALLEGGATSAVNSNELTDDLAAQIMVQMREHMMAWGEAQDEIKPEGHTKLDIEDDGEAGYPAFAGECLRFLAPRLAAVTSAKGEGSLLEDFRQVVRQRDEMQRLLCSRPEDNAVLPAFVKWSRGVRESLGL